MPALPTSAKGTATSRRILDAAAGEFAERGIAGARVDRIVAAAQTNKAQLYGYFGGKDGLFDAVVAESVHDFTSAVPFDAGNLAGWAAGLYDELLRRPDLVRLITWLRLERRPAGLITDEVGHEPKLADLARAQAAGRVRPGDPFDLLALVIAMACAWSPASGIYTATADEPAADHQRRRELLRDCVRRAVAP